MSNTLSGHTLGRSGRDGAQRWGRGGAGPSRTGRRPIGLPMKQRALFLPRNQKTCLERFFGSTTDGGKNKGLLTGTITILRSWLVTNVQTPICFCKPLNKLQRKTLLIYLGNCGLYFSSVCSLIRLFHIPETYQGKYAAYKFHRSYSIGKRFSLWRIALHVPSPQRGSSVCCPAPPGY